MTNRARVLACAVIASAGCGKLPTAPQHVAPSARTGTNVGVASVFFADFAALAKAGKLTALTPLLVKAIANGTAADMLNALQILQDNSKSAPYAQALGTLLNSQDQAPLSALLSQNGPVHLLASDPSAAQSVATLATFSRTGVLRQIGYQTMDTFIQSPLTAALLPGVAESLREGGADALTYAGAAMALTQSDAFGNTVPMGIANTDLLLTLRSEGRIHPLIDPWTSALSDAPVAEGLRAAGTMIDDLRNSPEDLAVWNASLDSLGAVMGTGVLDAQLTSPDGVSPSPVQLMIDSQILGYVPLVPVTVVQGAASNALQSQMQVININMLDAFQTMLGAGGTVGTQMIQALQNAQASDGLPVDQVVSAFQPYLMSPYCNGQPIAVGSTCNGVPVTSDSPVGYLELNQVVGDGLYAYVDNSKLISFLKSVDENLGGIASTELAQTYQCGPITTDSNDPNYPVNHIPTYPFSISLEMFDDVANTHVAGVPDDLAATQRMTFLACFFSRQGRLPAIIGTLTQNALVQGLESLGLISLPDLTPGAPNSAMNPTVQYTTQNDAQGIAMLGAMFDPDFNLNQTDETALGPHTRYGPLRILMPAFQVLRQQANTDPTGVYTNLLRYFITLSSATVATSYVGPDGASHPIVGNLINPILPLIQPLLSSPSVQASAGNQLFTLFWDRLQSLPVDGNTVSGTLMSAAAEALVRRSDPTLPPLWQPLLDALTAHKDDMDRTNRALWPSGGAFALDSAPGSPLVMADVMLSGGNGATGLSGTFAGPAPRATAPAELQTLLGTPLDQTLQMTALLRQIDPNSNLYFQGQRLLSEGASPALARSGAATLAVPGILDLSHLLLQIDLLPQTVDLIELVDQAQLTPGVLSLGDSMVQAGAAVEALDLVQLTLQDTTP